MKAMLNLVRLAGAQSGFYLRTSKATRTQKSIFKPKSRAGNLGQFD